MSFYGQTIKDLKNNFFSSLKIYNYNNIIKNSYPTDGPSLGPSGWFFNDNPATSKNVAIRENNKIEVLFQKDFPKEQAYELKQFLPDIQNGKSYQIIGQVELAPNATISIQTAGSISSVKIKNFDLKKKIWKNIQVTFQGSVKSHNDSSSFGANYDYISFSSFSPYTLKDLRIVEENFNIEAKNMNDSLTLEAGRNIRFSKAPEDDSAIVIEHDKANSQENTPVVTFNPKDSTNNNVDLSNDITANINLYTRNYDNLGHVNENTTPISLNFNVKTIKGVINDLENRADVYQGLMDNLRDTEGNNIPIDSFSLYDYIQFKVIQKIKENANSFQLQGTTTQGGYLSLDIIPIPNPTSTTTKN